MVIMENCWAAHRRIWELQVLQKSVRLNVNFPFKIKIRMNMDAVVEYQMGTVGGTQNQRPLAAGQAVTLRHNVQQ